ncbi:mothers against decapentaplegic homolog 6-like isoform X2 [Thrips palmi]|uniref:Mothers against decapentaplegic homolog n=1 Tax=Thrips palmi TaxID=161013 RepID=A0A6P8ZV51_THRPL|nr:mothers against decapentaplegic homolog 6-like isoform X2 [Thrips palmi]
MFMFRNRRNTLAKRLWNARVLQRGDHAASPAVPAASAPSQQALLRNTFLKRLKEPQLETLLQAVESRGASLTSCVVLDAPSLGPGGPLAGTPGLSGPAPAEPHLLCCQIWRWPELQQGSELRQLPMCTNSSATTICCNPYHWSRLCKPDCAPSEGGHAVQRVPPSPPREDPLDPLSHDEHDGHAEPCKAAAWGRTPPRWQDWQSWQGSLTTNGEGATGLGLPPELRPWCQLAYWELADRVGRLYEVHPPFINVSAAAEPSNQGLCLATLANHAPPRPAGTPPALAVERTRAKIGLGVTLSQEEDGVWAYNRSDNPIFVNSPTLDDPESRTLLVYRVPPGHCLNVFRADTTTEHWERWRRFNEATNSGPVDPNAVRISFAKGWGPKYSRQEVTACPCWIEVLLSPCR